MDNFEKARKLPATEDHYEEQYKNNARLNSKMSVQITILNCILNFVRHCAIDIPNISCKNAMHALLN